MQNKNWSKKLILVAAGAAILFYYLYNRQEEQAASMQAAYDMHEHEKAKAVTVLPPGTEEAWGIYVDRRLTSMLQRNGSSVRLADFMSKALSQTTIVSVNSPYEISCDRMGASIRFPQIVTKYDDEEDTLTLYVYILNPLTLNSAHWKTALQKSVYINPDSPSEQPPPLGVDDESIAANALFDHLCQRITNKVQEIFSQQIRTSESIK